MTYKPADFETLTKDLSDIIQWAGKCSAGASDRIRIYRDNIIEMLERNDKEGRTQVYLQLQSEGRINEILSTYVEGIEFVDSIKVLRAHDVNIPRATLERIRLGPADAAREDCTSNGSRNLMFELSIAAMFARAGFRTTLGKGSQSDVIVQIEDRTVLVECKRALVSGTVGRLIKDAVKQLNRKVSNKANECGLVGISITRTFTAGDRIFEVQSLPAAQTFVSDLVEERITAVRPELDGIPQSKAAAIIFHMTLPLQVNGKGFTPATDAMVYALPSPADRASFVKSIISKLRPR